MGMAVGMPDVKGLPAAVDMAKNPLADTHEFRQACSICFVKTGEGSTDGPFFTSRHTLGAAAGAKDGKEVTF